MSDRNTHLRRLGPWRRAFQWLMTAIVLLLPWIQPGGSSLLRIDIPTLSLHFFGQLLRIEDLFLFLLFVLTIGTGFLLITLIFGRIWCGWGCPQTTWNDLAEWLARRLKLKVVANRLTGGSGHKIIVHIGYLLLALLVSANLIWYFIEPQRFFSTLVRGTMHTGVLLTFLITTLGIYLNLALIRRLMCREFCPYGRIQSSLVDPGTLTLQLPDRERHRCIRCNSCVRVCPMDIDIRDGYQIECINCGRCLDACRNIMYKRGEKGLIDYSFGVDNAGAGALFNPRVVILGLLFLLLSAALAFAAIHRAEATLKIAVSPAISSRILTDGSQTTLFNIWINNRSSLEQEYHLAVFGETGETLELKGQTARIIVNAGSNHRLDAVLLSPTADRPYLVEFRLVGSQQQVMATAKARVTPLPRN